MQTVGSYRILETLWTGVGRSVYRAVDGGGTNVIIKYWPDGGARQRSRSELEHEYSLLNALHEPHICRVLDRVSSTAGMALVLEDIGGESLRDVLRRSGALPIRDAVEIGKQVALGLAELHASGIVHRDINPGNVIWNEATRQAQIIDLGIALPPVSHRTPHSETEAHHWRGTMRYIAPEQTGRLARGVDYRADIYSLGISLYELITGAPPFMQEDTGELVHAHVAMAPEPISNLRSEISPALAQLVHALIAKEPESRYQSCTALAFDLVGMTRHFDHRLHSDQSDSRDDFHAPQFGRRVLGPLSHAGQLRLDTEIIGRDEEFALLVREYGRVQAGGLAVVGIYGAPGLGKTALTRAFAERAGIDSGQFVVAKFDAFQRELPYGPLSASLRDMLQRRLTLPERRLAPWRRQMQSTLGEDARLLLPLLPELADLLELEGDTAPQIDGFEAEHRFSTALLAFIQGFSTREQPLVLLLDDVQWSDPSSVSFLRRLISSDTLHHVLVIGTVRPLEDELEPEMQRFLAEFSETTRSGHSIELANLSLDNVLAFISSATSIAGEEPRLVELAQIAHTKTGGNPFFLREFIRELVSRRTMRFVVPQTETDWVEGQGAWLWDIDQVANATATDNVLDLVIARVSSLPEQEREVLEIASCIGDSVTVDALLPQVPFARTAVEGALDAAVRLSLMSLRRSTACNDANMAFIFVHDRVREGIYHGISSEMRTSRHLRIAENLANSGEALDDIALFSIVDHLLRGMDDAGQTLPNGGSQQWVSLLLRAGERAFATIAFGLGLSSARLACTLIRQRADEIDADQKFEAYYQWAKFAQGRGALQECELAIGEGLAALDNDPRGIRLLQLKIVNEALAGRMVQSVSIAIDVMAALGYDFPRYEWEKAQQAEHAKLQVALAGKDVMELAQLPAATDPTILQIVGTLALMTSAARFLDSSLFALVATRMVSLMIEHGLAGRASQGMSLYGVACGTVRYDYEQGVQFGRLALKLAQDSGSEAQLCQTSFILGNRLLGWTRPLVDVRELNARGREAGLRAGDNEHLGFIAMSEPFVDLFVGVALPTIYENLERLAQETNRYGNRTAQSVVAALGMFVERMLDGESTDLALESQSYTAANYVATFERERGIYGLAHFYILSGIAAYHLQGFSQAVAYFRAARPLLPVIANCYIVSRYYAYFPLSMLALAQSDPAILPQDQIELSECLRQLERLYQTCPENFEHLWRMVIAEQERHAGRATAAYEHLDAAIFVARNIGCHLSLGLVHTLIASSLRQRGLDAFADTHIEHAILEYRVLGASALVSMLGQLYPHLVRLKGSHFHTSSLPRGNLTTDGVADLVDITAVLKSTRVLSGTLDKRELYAALLDIAVQNAGAERGELALWDPATASLVPVMVRDGSPNSKAVEPSEVQTYAPTALMNLVIRTHRQVVVARAAQDDRFSGDVEVARRKIQSMMAIPIIQGSSLLAVLYLEHCNLSGAFTPKRVETLRLVATHAAVSVQNAGLYSSLQHLNAELEQRVKERTLELERAQAQLIERAHQAGMAQLAADVLHNVGNLLNNISASVYAVRTISTGSAQRILIQGIEKLQSLDGGYEAGMKSDLGLKFLSAIPRLTDALVGERTRLSSELDRMQSTLRTLTDVIAAQQRFARVDGLREKSDLRGLIRDFLELQGEHLRKNRVSLIPTLGDVEQVYVDRSKFVHILTNLIKNAQEAMHDAGTLRPKLKILLRQDGDNVVLEVADNGPGVDSENLSRIFAHGFTTKPTGHGFGLHSCANYMTEMSGRMWAESGGPGKGTSFFLRFPTANSLDRGSAAA